MCGSISMRKKSWLRRILTTYNYLANSFQIALLKPYILIDNSPTNIAFALTSFTYHWSFIPLIQSHIKIFKFTLNWFSSVHSVEKYTIIKSWSSVIANSSSFSLFDSQTFPSITTQNYPKNKTILTKTNISTKYMHG